MAQQPIITVTPDEWACGALGPAKLAAALEQLHRTGFTTIENCIPHERLDELVGRLDYDAAHQVASEEKWTERGPFGGGHLQLGLPRCAPFVAPELVANPILEQLAAAYLGRCYLGFYNGNTNTPGSHFSQPLHLDGDWYWKSAAEAAADGVSWPPPPTGVVANFGCRDITEADGTEV